MKKLILILAVVMTLLVGCSTESADTGAEVSKAQFESVKVDDFDFSDLSIKNVAGSWIGAVEIKNTGTVDYEAIMFSVSFYDKEGKRLGTAQGALTGLTKSESKTADLISIDDLKGYTDYKIQIDTKV